MFEVFVTKFSFYSLRLQNTRPIMKL